MKGIVGKTVLFFIFAVIVYMGTTSFTNKMLPPDSSNMVGAIFASIAFVGSFILSWLTTRKKKEKK